MENPRPDYNGHIFYLVYSSRSFYSLSSYSVAVPYTFSHMDFKPISVKRDSGSKYAMNFYFPENEFIVFCKSTFSVSSGISSGRIFVKPYYKERADGKPEFSNGEIYSF